MLMAHSPRITLYAMHIGTSRQNDSALQQAFSAAALDDNASSRSKGTHRAQNEPPRSVSVAAMASPFGLEGRLSFSASWRKECAGTFG